MRRELTLEERKDALRAAIAALPATPERPERLGSSVQLSRRVYKTIARAATARRMHLSSYIRRAAYAMAAKDLGIPLSDILALDPYVSRETGHRVSDPKGTKFGPWEIDRLVEEVPDERSAADEPEAEDGAAAGR